MSSKNRKGQQSGKDQLTFDDLGLKTALPSVMTTTKDQRKEHKVLEKKAKNERFKAAMKELEASKEKVDKHQEFMKAEKEKEVEEKKQRKLELKREHMRSRAHRDLAEKKRDKELIERQQEALSRIRDTLQEKRAEEEAMRAIIEAQIEEAAQEAPAPVNIPVIRKKEIQDVRATLPAMAKEHDFMEAIFDKRNHCVLVCGDTGSGKTTQFPQFLWESGFGHKEGESVFRDGIIGVTEPRRVAATSMARRISEELNEPFGETVCFHVRYHNNLPQDPSKIKMKVMTEGILLKELESDFLLSKYSAVVIDEAHERSVSCDLLIGLLSRVVPLRQALHDEEVDKRKTEAAARRNATGQEVPLESLPKIKVKPLKLIIMSATLRIDDFRANEKLFPKVPPLIQVEGRRYPVHTHFAKKTSLDRYVDEASKKARQVHRKLPPGGILIFLSTQREIDDLCETLRVHYSKTRIVYDSEKYNKHSQLKSRQVKARAALDKTETKNKKSNEANEEDGATPAEEEDAFGLKNEDYALEGDEDYPEDEAAGKDGKKGGNSIGELLGLKDDFDYGMDLDEEVSASQTGGKRTAKEKPVASSSTGKNQSSLRKRRRVEEKKKTSLFGGEEDFEVEEEDEWAQAAKDGDDPKEGDETPHHGIDEADADEEYEEGEVRDNYGDDEEGEEEEEDAKPQEEDGEKEEELEGELDTMHILPLYSLLNPQEQARVFEDVPQGKRLCVIATNIAETSITIPGIRYVIDAGRVKTKTLHPETGAQVFSIRWTSQAAAEQRSGRAGRTAPGHCYRLFSTAVFANHMPKHPDPEILRTPLESVVLMMKHMKIDHVGNFPYPTSPSPEALAQSLRHLCLIGALDVKSKRCTSLGSLLSSFPVAPRFARMIVAAHSDASFVQKLIGSGGVTASSSQRRSRQRVIDAICLAAAIASTTLDAFGSRGNGRSLEAEKIRANHKKISDSGSDYVSWARALMAFAGASHFQEERRKRRERGEHVPPTDSHAYQPSPFEVCQELGMTFKSIKEAWQLVRQLKRQCTHSGLPCYSNDGMSQTRQDKRKTEATPHSPALEDFEHHEGLDDTGPDDGDHKEERSSSSHRILPSTKEDGFEFQFGKDEEAAVFRKIVALGLVDHVARRATPVECRQQNLLYNDSKTSKVPYFDFLTGEIMCIHPSSSCSKTSPPPQFLVYTSLQRIKRAPQTTDGEKQAPKMEWKSKGFGKNAKQVLKQVQERPSVFMKGVTCVTRSWLDEIGWSEEVADRLRTTGSFEEQAES